MGNELDLQELYWYANGKINNSLQKAFINSDPNEIKECNMKIVNYLSLLISTTALIHSTKNKIT